MSVVCDAVGAHQVLRDSQYCANLFGKKLYVHLYVKILQCRL